MSQVAKVLQILDLFSEQHTTLSAEEIAELMALPRTTAFRQVRQLCDAGLLTKLSTRYALGARIIHLDYKIRRFDPLLLASLDAMKALAHDTTCTAVLSNLYGDEVMAVHVEPGQDIAALSFGRGMPFPLFRGAPSKVILANLPLSRLRALYKKHGSPPAIQGFGEDFEGFMQTLRDCKKQRYAVSHGEVDPHVTGLACAIVPVDGLVAGSIGVAFESARESLFNESTLAGKLMNAATAIAERLALSTR